MSAQQATASPLSTPSTPCPQAADFRASKAAIAKTKAALLQWEKQHLDHIAHSNAEDGRADGPGAVRQNQAVNKAKQAYDAAVAAHARLERIQGEWRAYHAARAKTQAAQHRSDRDAELTQLRREREGKAPVEKVGAAGQVVAVPAQAVPNAGPAGSVKVTKEEKEALLGRVVHGLNMKSHQGICTAVGALYDHYTEYCVSVYGRQFAAKSTLTVARFLTCGEAKEADFHSCVLRLAVSYLAYVADTKERSESVRDLCDVGVCENVLQCVNKRAVDRWERLCGATGADKDACMLARWDQADVPAEQEGPAPPVPLSWEDVAPLATGQPALRPVRAVADAVLGAAALERKDERPTEYEEHKWVFAQGSVAATHFREQLTKAVANQLGVPGMDGTRWAVYGASQRFNAVADIMYCCAKKDGPDYLRVPGTEHRPVDHNDGRQVAIISVGGDQPAGSAHLLAVAPVGKHGVWPTEMHPRVTWTSAATPTGTSICSTFHETGRVGKETVNGYTVQLVLSDSNTLAYGALLHRSKQGDNLAELKEAVTQEMAGTLCRAMFNADPTCLPQHALTAMAASIRGKPIHSSTVKDVVVEVAKFRNNITEASTVAAHKVVGTWAVAQTVGGGFAQVAGAYCTAAATLSGVAAHKVASAVRVAVPLMCVAFALLLATVATRQIVAVYGAQLAAANTGALRYALDATACLLTAALVCWQWRNRPQISVAAVLLLIIFMSWAGADEEAERFAIKPYAADSQLALSSSDEFSLATVRQFKKDVAEACADTLAADPGARDQLRAVGGFLHRASVYLSTAADAVYESLGEQRPDVPELTYEQWLAQGGADNRDALVADGPVRDRWRTRVPDVEALFSQAGEALFEAAEATKHESFPQCARPAVENLVNSTVSTYQQRFRQAAEQAANWVVEGARSAFVGVAGLLGYFADKVTNVTVGLSFRAAEQPWSPTMDCLNMQRGVRSSNRTCHTQCKREHERRSLGAERGFIGPLAYGPDSKRTIDLYTYAVWQDCKSTCTRRHDATYAQLTTKTGCDQLMHARLKSPKSHAGPNGAWLERSAGDAQRRGLGMLCCLYILAWSYYIVMGAQHRTEKRARSGVVDVASAQLLTWDQLPANSGYTKLPGYCVDSVCLGPCTAPIDPAHRLEHGPVHEAGECPSVVGQSARPGRAHLTGLACGAGFCCRLCPCNMVNALKKRHLAPRPYPNAPSTVVACRSAAENELPVPAVTSMTDCIFERKIGEFRDLTLERPCCGYQPRTPSQLFDPEWHAVVRDMLASERGAYQEWLDKASASDECACHSLPSYFWESYAARQLRCDCTTRVSTRSVAVEYQSHCANRAGGYTCRHPGYKMAPWCYVCTSREVAFPAYAQVLDQCRERLAGLTKDAVAMATTGAWEARFNGPLDEMLDAEINGAELDDQVNAQVKLEAGHKIPSKARVIMANASKASQVKFAREQWAAQKSLAGVFNLHSSYRLPGPTPRWVTPVYASGLTPKQLASVGVEYDRMVASCRKGEHVFIIEVDGENWDARVNAHTHHAKQLTTSVAFSAMRQLRHRLMKYVDDIACVDGHTRMSTATGPFRLSYTKCYGTASGHNDTTYGNTAINIAVWVEALASVTSVLDALVLAAGDDTLLIVKCNTPNCPFDQLVAVLKAYGIVPVGRYWNDLERASFISAIWAKDNAGEWNFVPAPGRLLTRLFWTPEPPSRRNKPAYLAGIVAALAPTLKRMPFMRDWIQWHWRPATREAVERVWSVGRRARMMKYAYEPYYATGASLDRWFYERYGTNALEVDAAVAATIAKADGDGLIMHPLLKRICAIDLADAVDRFVE